MIFFSFPARLFRKAARGAFTLTELAIVLGISGFVLAAIWVAGSMAWDNYQLARVQEQIVTVIKNVRDSYGLNGRPLPGGGTATAFSTANSNINELLPSDMYVNGTTFQHAFGGPFEIWATGGDIEIRLRNISKSDCMKILMEFPVLSPTVGVRNIGVAGTMTNVNLANIANPGGGVTLPFSTAGASSLCNATNNEVRIDFILRN